MSAKYSIVLVDDHTIVRNGLKSLIEVVGDYEVIAQFDNGRRFIDAIDTLPKIDLAIVDLNMPEMNGLETVRWLHQNKKELKVLILTLESDDKTIIELFRLGVRGYLPKSCSAEVLKKAIEDTVHSGYYHSEILQNALITATDKNEEGKVLSARISERERDFIRLVCDKEEYTYDQIASKMNVHRRTVDGYREVLFEKFHVKSKTGLVLFAIKHGLVTV